MINTWEKEALYYNDSLNILVSKNIYQSSSQIREPEAWHSVSWSYKYAVNWFRCYTSAQQPLIAGRYKYIN